MTLESAVRSGRHSAPMGLPILFDAVLFDLDGTLVATDRFWVEAADAGARRAFRALGLQRPLPGRADWLGLVGRPIEEGFRALFPDLGEDDRRFVLAECVREEERALANGGAAAMPRALETLQHLRSRGVELGIASNCSRAYLEHMLDSLGLRPLVGAAFCLESSGVESKRDMVAGLLEHFGTESAVMVGDRAGDRDAAWANGIPHVHCAFGFARADEPVAADAAIGDLGELPHLFEARSARIAALALDLGAPARIAITGGPAAGKTLFARDLARVLRVFGRPAVAVALEAFERPSPFSAWEHDPLAKGFALERLIAELLEPHARGEPLRLASPGLDGEEVVPPDATLVLEGPFLGDPRLAPFFARLVHLAVPPELSLRRIEARARRAGLAGQRALEHGREVLLPLHAEHERRLPPACHASRVLDASNPLFTGA